MWVIALNQLDQFQLLVLRYAPLVLAAIAVGGTIGFIQVFKRLDRIEQQLHRIEQRQQIPPPPR